jgi:hypothetical protein
MPGDCNQTRHKIFDANQTESQSRCGSGGVCGQTVYLQICQFRFAPDGDMKADIV